MRMDTQYVTLTSSDPRLRHRLPADEHHNRRGARSHNRFDQRALRTYKRKTTQIDVLARRRVRARLPEEGLVQAPGADHDDGDVGCVRGGERFGELRLVGRPELAALCEVDGGRAGEERAVGEQLREALERREGVEGRVVEDVVAELWKWDLGSGRSMSGETHSNTVDLRANQGDRADVPADGQYIIAILEEDDLLLLHLM